MLLIGMFGETRYQTLNWLYILCAGKYEECLHISDSCLNLKINKKGIPEYVDTIN